MTDTRISTVFCQPVINRPAGPAFAQFSALFVFVCISCSCFVSFSFRTKSTSSTRVRVREREICMYIYIYIYRERERKRYVYVYVCVVCAESRHHGDDSGRDSCSFAFVLSFAVLVSCFSQLF